MGTIWICRKRYQTSWIITPATAASAAMPEKQTGYNTPAAENLKRLLKERGITGYEFAVTVGYTPQQLTDMMHHRKIMRPPDIAALIDALGVEASELFKK